MADDILGFTRDATSTRGGTDKTMDGLAGTVQNVFFGVGRGGLDAIGLEGRDIKGFDGGVSGPDGQAMAGGDFMRAIGRMDRDGLDSVMGKGFESDAFSAGRDLFLRGNADMERSRQGVGRGE